VAEGFEILVGRGEDDNDHLPFDVAEPHDLWLRDGGGENGQSSGRPQSREGSRPTSGRRARGSARGVVLEGTRGILGRLSIIARWRTAR
jgi:hypothetical protein